MENHTAPDDCQRNTKRAHSTTRVARRFRRTVRSLHKSFVPDRRRARWFATRTRAVWSMESNACAVRPFSSHCMRPFVVLVVVETKEFNSNETKPYARSSLCTSTMLLFYCAVLWKRAASPIVWCVSLCVYCCVLSGKNTSMWVLCLFTRKANDYFRALHICMLNVPIHNISG